MSERSANSGPIALTVLGGFLGAGKTTLLNHLLRSSHGERLLVMVNDFGSINIDAELVASQAPGGSEGIINLANGCACCAIGGDLMQAFLKVLSLPQLPERVLVEVSGVGDPARIAAMGMASGGRFRSDGVITVVDAQAIQSLAADRYVGETVQAQLCAANLLVLNKTDLLSSAAVSGLLDWLAGQFPDAPVLESQFGVVAPEVVLGPALGVSSGDTETLQFPHLGPDHASHFASHTFTTNRPLERSALEAALDALPDHILRAKGLVYLTGETAPRVLQLCGRQWSLRPLSIAQDQDSSRIVLIGARRPDVAVFDPWAHFESAMVDGD